MSWAQVDGATDDKELKQLTTVGSIGFLGGVSRIQEALIKLDQGKLAEAATNGKAAMDDFSIAMTRFDAAAQRLENTQTLLRGSESTWKMSSLQSGPKHSSSLMARSLRCGYISRELLMKKAPGVFL